MQNSDLDFALQKINMLQMSMQSCKQLNIKLWKQSVNVPLGPENWFLFLTSHPSKDLCPTLLVYERATKYALLQQAS